MNENEQSLIERALIGLMIIKPSLFSKILGALTIENFLNPDLKLIFNTLQTLFNQKSKVDILILSDELTKLSNKNKDFWTEFLSQLTIDSGYESSIDKYIDILNDKKQTRDLKKTLNLSLQKVESETMSAKDLVEKIESDIFNVTRDRKLKDFESVENIINDFNKRLNLIKTKGYQEGEQSRLLGLDKMLGGFKKGELIIVAARPSMGKTAFALQIINNISKMKNVGLFSLEMSSQSIIQRLISIESGVGQDFIRNYDKLPENRIELIKKSTDSIQKRNLWIDDTPGLKIGELVWKIRKLNSLVELDLVVIDYLQLIEGEGSSKESRQQVISDISRTLKSISRELHIPIIALSQLSRKVESREDKKPMMSDLRESGAIEQDADVILLLYRPSYYKRDEDSNVVEDLEVIISKNRNGKTGIISFDMNMELGRITSKSMERF